MAWGGGTLSQWWNFILDRIIDEVIDEIDIVDGANIGVKVGDTFYPIIKK